MSAAAPSDDNEFSSDIENAMVIEGSDLDELQYSENESRQPSLFAPPNDDPVVGYYAYSQHYSRPPSVPGSVPTSVPGSYGSMHSMSGFPPSAATPFTIPSTHSSDTDSISAANSFGNSSVPMSAHYYRSQPSSFTGSNHDFIGGSVQSNHSSTDFGDAADTNGPNSILHTPFSGSVPGSVPGFSHASTPASSQPQPGSSTDSFCGIEKNGFPRRASATQIYSKPDQSYSTTASANSRHPHSASYLAPSQIERSREYSHHPASATPHFFHPHFSSAFSQPTNASSFGQTYGQPFGQPSLSVTTSFSPKPSPTSPTKPQRSLLSSMIAQSRGTRSVPVASGVSNNGTNGVGTNNVGTNNVGNNSTGTIGTNGVSNNGASSNDPNNPDDPNSSERTAIFGSFHSVHSAKSGRSIQSVHEMPAEPVLMGRQSVDLNYLQRTVASPPLSSSFDNLGAFTPRIMHGLTRPRHLKTFHFANCDTKQVVKMMTLALNHIIKGNDQKYPSNNDGKPLDLGPARDETGQRFQKLLLGFHGCNVPGIGLEDYLMRILRYCPTTANVFLSLLVYLDRLSGQGQQLSADHGESLFLLDSFNVHRLVIAGMAVAIKFHSDIFYKNSRYAQVGGLPIEELNFLELQFLLLLDFRLMISVEEMQKYADFILNYAERENTMVEYSEAVKAPPHPQPTPPVGIEPRN